MINSNYSDFIYLNKNFQPVYDIENEIQNSWKTFIPTSNFKEILKRLFNSLESSDSSQKKSFWLQGTYGTGKSHTAAVIKHLLSDPIDEIEDYIDENFEDDIQLKERLKNFRRHKKKFLAVTLKGADTINNPNELGIAIQIAIKKVLKKYENIKKVKYDFDTIIEKLESGVIVWDLVAKGTRLENYSKEDLIKLLKDEDINVLSEVENVLASANIHITTDNFTDWLIDVVKNLKEQNIADGIFIFWDEFTSVLYHPNNNLLLQSIQNIAELSKNQDIYLFLITHRTLDTVSNTLDYELVRKLKDRFEVFKYQMEPITTFYLLSKLIKIKKEVNDDQKNNFERFKDYNTSKIEDLIRSFVNDKVFTSSVEIKDFKNLFPLHPYTVYLATFISRYLGSTNRSIFSFIYDSERGFVNFINHNPLENGQVFMTAESLWDYFYEEFRDYEEKEIVWQILEKFNSYKEKFEKLDDKDYMRIFKIILLLNFLSFFVDVSEIRFLNPTRDVIKFVFKGDIDEIKVDKILNYVKENNIIEQAPDGKFLVNISRISDDELRNKMKHFEDKYRYIDSIFKIEPYKQLMKNLEEEFSKNSVRKVELKCIDSYYFGRLSSSMDNFNFDFDYSIKILLILSRNKNQKDLVKEQISEISKQERFKDVIFIVPETEFDDETFNKFIKYKALSELETNQKRKESYLNYSLEVLRDWLLNKLYKGLSNVYLNGNEKVYWLNYLKDKLISDFSEKIFEYGFERLKILLNNQNNWKEKISAKVIEEVLFADSRDKLEEAFSKSHQYKNLINIFKDNNQEYIVDKSLNFKDEGINEEHPLWRLNNYIDKYIIEESEKGYFNLARLMKEISKPPFGVFPCEVYSVALSFVFRKYVNKLFLKYDSELTTEMNIKVMKEKLAEAFKRKSIYVRLGSEYEKKLLELLKEIFGLNEFNNLRDLKWEVRKRLLPLWMIEKHFENNFDYELSLEVLQELYNKFISPTDSEEINSENLRILVEKIERFATDLKLLIKNLFDSEEQIIKEYILEYLESKNLTFNFDPLIDKITEEIKRELEQKTYEIQEKEIQEKIEEKIKHTLVEKIEEFLRLEKDVKIFDYLPIWLINNSAILSEESKKLIEKFYKYFEISRSNSKEIKDIVEAIEFLDKNKIGLKDSIHLINTKKDELIKRYVRELTETFVKQKNSEKFAIEDLLVRLYPEVNKFINSSITEEEFKSKFEGVISRLISTPSVDPKFVVEQIKEKIKDGDKDFELYLIQIFKEYPEILSRIAEKLEERKYEKKGIFSFLKPR